LLQQARTQAQRYADIDKVTPSRDQSGKIFPTGRGGTSSASRCEYATEPDSVRATPRKFIGDSLRPNRNAAVTIVNACAA